MLVEELLGVVVEDGEVLDYDGKKFCRRVLEFDD